MIILSYKDLFSLLYDNELWLVMELCDGGSLYDLKEANRGGFSEAQLRAIMAFWLALLYFFDITNSLLVLVLWDWLTCMHK